VFRGRFFLYITKPQSFKVEGKKGHVSKTRRPPNQIFIKIKFIPLEAAKPQQTHPLRIRLKKEKFESK